MVDQIVTRYKNINTYEFAGHSYINLINVCDFQNSIHDNPEKQKLKKKQRPNSITQNYTMHQQ